MQKCVAMFNKNRMHREHSTRHPRERRAITSIYRQRHRLIEPCVYVFFFFSFRSRNIATQSSRLIKLELRARVYPL